MVHPGYVDIDTLQFSSYNHQRIMEATVLLDKEIKKYMSDNNIELVSYLNVGEKMATIELQNVLKFMEQK